MREPIAVIGTGYVGLVTAAGFAELGSEVWCVDIDAEKIAGLERGEIPIYEPGLAEVVERHRARLHFTTDLAPALEHARLLFVAVGTPPTYSGDADLSAVHAVVRAMPPSDRHALVMKSTVPVGTGASIKRVFAEQDKAGFRYVSCPEFLKEGSALKDFLNPDRVVVGDDGDWAGDAVVDLYAPLGAPLVRTDISSAEMVKLASNAFLATKISFINEIANVCEETGADVAEVAKGMGLDARIGQSFLRPGIGFGGSCVTGDETLLVRHAGHIHVTSFADLWSRLAEFGEEETVPGLLKPDDLEVLSQGGRGAPSFERVTHVTRRHHAGDLLTVRTTTGRSVRCTPDHPLLVADGAGAEPWVQLADRLTTDDRLPVVPGAVLNRAARPPALTAAHADGNPSQKGPQTGSFWDELGDPALERATVGPAWDRIVSVARERWSGDVYSLETPPHHAWVRGDGLVVHNCFPKDVSALKQLAGNSGYHFQLLTSVIEVNELQKRRVIQKLQKHLGSLVGKDIALLGLAFKPETDDMREASSLVLAARLQADGARVRAYDPVAEDEARKLMTGVDFEPDALSAVTGADAVVLVTEWPEFGELDLTDVADRMRGDLVVDGRNFLEPGRVREAGLTYEGVGRPAGTSEGVGQPA